MLGELNDSQVKKTSKILGIPADFIKKDYFVTLAIHTLTRVKNDYFDLIFQGGTSLAKGYQAVSRLSEDIDFRVVLKPAAYHLGKETRRKLLRHFRYSLVDALAHAGFLIDQKEIKVFYEGRYMSIRANFEGSSNITYLKPHIAIDCFVGDLMLTPQIVSITSLIKTTLGKECTHNLIQLSCISLDETAAEKWVALTRRIANSQEKERETDKHLVRHIYDLYQLQSKELLTGEYKNLILSIIKKDSSLFKRHNTHYIKDPIQASQQALATLTQESAWQQHWKDFCNNMVYGNQKPDFFEAIEKIKLMSLEIF